MKLSKRKYRKLLELESGNRIKWIRKFEIEKELNLEINTLRTKIITDGKIIYSGKHRTTETSHILRCSTHKLKVQDASAVIIEQRQTDLDDGEDVVNLTIYGGYMTAKNIYIDYIKDKQI